MGKIVFFLGKKILIHWNWTNDIESPKHALHSLSVRLMDELLISYQMNGKTRMNQVHQLAPSLLLVLLKLAQRRNTLPIKSNNFTLSTIQEE